MKPIFNDSDFVSQLDEIKLSLGCGMPLSPMRKEFDNMVNDFIKSWNLNKNPNAFVSMPIIEAPKFKVGDKVKLTSKNVVHEIVNLYSVLSKNDVVNRYIVKNDLGAEIDVFENNLELT